MLVNDRAVLSATDATFDSGAISIFARRSGSADDSDPIAVLMRNLRASTLMDGDPTRAPLLQEP